MRSPCASKRVTTAIWTLGESVRPATIPTSASRRRLRRVRRDSQGGPSLGRHVQVRQWYGGGQRGTARPTWTWKRPGERTVIVPHQRQRRDVAQSISDTRARTHGPGQQVIRHDRPLLGTPLHSTTYSNNTIICPHTATVIAKATNFSYISNEDTADSSAFKRLWCRETDHCTLIQKVRSLSISQSPMQLLHDYHFRAELHTSMLICL